MVGAFAVKLMQFVCGDESLELFEVEECRVNLGDEVFEFAMQSIHRCFSVPSDAEASKQE